jgi:hypothetical protein
MHIELSDEEAAALLAELDRLIDGDRYFLSPRVERLKAIRARIEPYPALPAASPAQKLYASPSKGRYKRRAR